MTLTCATSTSKSPSSPDVQASLPAPLGDLVRCLQDRLDLPGPVCAAVALQAIAAAVGPAAVLRDDPTPPLSPSLNMFIAARPGSPNGSRRHLFLQALTGHAPFGLADLAADVSADNKPTVRATP